jgi:hypothetical protein
VEIGPECDDPFSPKTQSAVNPPHDAAARNVGATRHVYGNPDRIVDGYGLGSPVKDGRTASLFRQRRQDVGDLLNLCRHENIAVNVPEIGSRTIFDQSVGAP